MFGACFSPAWLVFLAVLKVSSPAQVPSTSPEELFERRIMPIFRSPQPSSCVQCHLAGVDLKHYILPSHEKTFRSLRDQGMIDLDRPEQSKVLKLISMGDEDRRAVAMIHAKNRKAEYEAFAAWIKACCADPQLRNAPKLDSKERALPPRPPEVIRHARKDRLLESFEQNVWAWRFRCMNCHTEGTPQNETHRKKYGQRVAWVKREGAEATMEYLLHSRLIDVDHPEESLLLRKPLGEVPHEGGTKFHAGDQGYKGFRKWIEDAAAIRKDKYAQATDLPPAKAGPQRFGSEIWFKLTDTPPEWGDKLLQVNLYCWDSTNNQWEPLPVATSDRLVSGQAKLWQHTLTLLAGADAARAKGWRTGKPALPSGRYLVKVFVDSTDRLDKDWRSVLGEAEFVGQAEFQARWRDGYGGMTSLSARKLRK